MYYEKDENNYITKVFFGCTSDDGIEYTGNMPAGYSNLVDWANSENILSWYIQEGNLLKDNNKEAELESVYESEYEDNKHVSNKDFKVVSEAVNTVTSSYPYKTKTVNGKLINVNDAKPLQPKIKIDNIYPYSYDKVDLLVTGKNMLPNTATSQEISGLTITQNTDRSITINGTGKGKNLITDSSLTKAPTISDNWSLGTMNNVTSSSYGNDGLTVTTPADGNDNNGSSIVIKDANNLIPAGTTVAFSIDITGASNFGRIRGYYRGTGQYFYSNYVTIISDIKSISNDTVRYSGVFIMPDVGTLNTSFYIVLSQGKDEIRTRTYKNMQLEINSIATNYEAYGKPISYNIAGINNNIKPLLAFKKNRDYYLSTNNFNFKMYNYDGTDRAEIYNGTGGLINYNEDKSVTQIVLSVPTNVEFDNITIYPQLDLGTESTEYEAYKQQKFSVDYSQFIDHDVLQPSDELFPSNTLYPEKSTTVVINLDGTTLSADISGDTIYYDDTNITMFEGINNVYTIQDTNIELIYSVDGLEDNGEFATKIELNQVEQSLTLEVSQKVGEDEFTKASIIERINDGTSEIQIQADNIDITGKAVNFTTDIKTDYTYTTQDLDNITQYLAGEIELTAEQQELYDANGDGKISSIDMFLILKAINSNYGNIDGTFQIDPYSTQRSIILKDYKEEITSYIGLYAMSSPTVISSHFISDNYVKVEDEGYSAIINADQIFMSIDGDDVNQTTITAEEITTPRVTQTSLESIKKNIEKTKINALKIINNSDIYTYNYKTEEDKDKKHFGFVIGDNYNTPAEVISNGKGIETYTMSSIMWKAIQELSKKIDELNKEINKLKGGD